MSQPQGTEVSLWWITRLCPGWGVFEGGTWATPKPYMPRTMCSFQLQMPEVIPLTSSDFVGYCPTKFDFAKYCLTKVDFAGNYPMKVDFAGYCQAKFLIFVGQKLILPEIIQ